MRIEIARVYDEIPGGTYRILVDRLWPRGIKKTSTKIDVWFKDAAPSTELRKWYGHDSEKAEEFKKKYVAELDENKDAVAELKKIIESHENPILVYAAKSAPNNATVLQEYLQ